MINMNKRYEISKQRLSICEECDSFEKTFRRCKECGCFMDAKTLIMEMICPLEKWGFVEEAKENNNAY